MTSQGIPRRVFIPTTAVPVEVERITEEDPDVNSVVCLGGKAVALPISNAYDAFVRDPTGVIQRRYGHAAYRVDVSGTVEDGYSWQLGLFLAHAAVAQDALAASQADAKILLATGEVDHDLNVLPVDHVPAKLDRLALLGGEIKGATFYLPEANAGEVDPAAAEALGIRVVPVATVADMLADAELAPAEAKPAKKPARRQTPVDLPHEAGRHPVIPTSDEGRSGIGWLGWTVVLLVAVVGSVGTLIMSGPLLDWVALQRDGRVIALDDALTKAAGLSERTQAKAFRHWLNWQKPPPDGIDIFITERHAPDGARCREVAFGRAQPKRIPVVSGPATDVLTSTRNGLCGLEVSARGRDGVFLWGRAVRWARGKPERDRPDSVMPLVRRDGALAWKADLPSSLPPRVTYRFVVLASPYPVSGPEAWVPEIYGLGGDGQASEEALRARQRLEQAGVTVKVVEHQIQN